MAAGLGTRMKSATPKHLHPLLGRRLVDWVVEAVRPVGADPLVVVASPDPRRRVRRRDRRGAGESARHGRLAARRARAASTARSSPRRSPATTRASASDLLEQLVDEHRASGATATVLSFEPPDPRAYGRIVRDGDGGLRADRRARRRRRARARDPRGQLLHLRVRGRQTLAGARADRAGERAGRALSDGCGAAAGRRRRGGRRVQGSGCGRGRGRQHARRARRCGSIPTRAREQRTHACRRHDRRSPDDLDRRRTSSSSPDSTIHPFTVLRGKTRVATGAEVGPHVVAIDAEIGPDAIVGPFCYLRPGHRARAKARRQARSSSSRTPRSARERRCRTSPISATRRSARARTSRAGNITANLRHQPGRPKRRTKIGRNVKTGIHNGFEAPVEIGDDAWIAGGAYITEDVPPESLAGFPPKQITKEGYLRGKRND